METTDGRGADVVITLTAANVALEQAIRRAVRRGRISFFGGLPKTNPLISCGSKLIHYRELMIVDTNGSTPSSTSGALELMSSGQVSVKDLITARVPLEKVLDAFGIV